MDDEGEKRKDVKREALSPRDHELPPEGASRKVEVKEADSASAEEEMSTELRVMSTASSLPGTTCAASKASSSLTSTSVSSASAGSILHVQVPGANGEAGSTTSPQLSTKSVASSSTDSGLCSPDSLHSSGSPETSVNAAGAANSASFVPAGGNSPKDASLGTFQQPRKRGNSASTLVHNRGISPSPGATVQHIFHGQGHGRRVAPLPPAVDPTTRTLTGDTPGITLLRTEKPFCSGKTFSNSRDMAVRSPGVLGAGIYETDGGFRHDYPGYTQQGNLTQGHAELGSGFEGQLTEGNDLTRPTALVSQARPCAVRRGSFWAPPLPQATRVQGPFEGMELATSIRWSPLAVSQFTSSRRLLTAAHLSHLSTQTRSVHDRQAGH
ncbi:hypothetical protein C0Q70_04302 [Pomacea canaliculata]|uniref:Uncharacterized protein n=1 Tax=Pomacea canaliculata TaxID=400727 RepID=A0A2T7PV58_POMCA|nr:hypothetical protein C0Q70_04302 [Pomacea canaliculata]